MELTNGCLCCSISSELRTAVWSLLQQADIGKIDYLVIETSGVTDPHATIATLEQDYGKMYRIRLDSVITIVDADALVAQLEGEEPAGQLRSAAADSQLRCADIVLLNKKDLVSETQLARAKDFILNLVPGVRVYPCQKCAVPLHYIMEVSEVSSAQVVSHEVVEAAYSISPEGGMLNQERHRRVKEKGEPTSFSHIAQDEFASISFESQRPFMLGAFQAFLGRKFPHSVTRVKGTIWFEENRGYLYSFHMSGRQRYEITSCASVSESLVGAFSVQLILIGRSIQPEELRFALENCLAPSRSSTSPIVAPSPELLGTLEKAKSTVTADDRFEVFPQLEPTNLCVDFRLTGCIEYGISAQEAQGRHGINFNTMNEELATRVNGSSLPLCLLPVQLPTGVQVCRYATHPDTPFEPVWDLVCEDAAKMIIEYYRAVGYCRCDV